MQLGKRELELVRSFASPFRIEDGRRFRLQDRDPGDTLHLDSADKPRARDGLRKGVEYLAALQDKLYAQDRWSVLLVFQAMDAAGKDSAIKHVLSGVNPQGCQVTSFKAPSAEELDHDYLWRCVKALPERGRIGIFNRSYYEEVLVARVHPEILARQKLPPRLVTGKKFFLHVSKDEQKKRFLERLDNPDKNWKFEMGDVRERSHWDDYQSAYEEAIRETARDHAPWYVVPADNKWFTRLVVACAIIDGLDSLDLAYPRVDAAKRRELAEARAALTAPAKAGRAPRRGG